MRKVNVTFELEEEDISDFNLFISNITKVKVIDFKILPNTDELYENDAYFKSLVKSKKKLQRQIDVYLNEKL